MARKKNGYFENYQSKEKINNYKVKKFRRSYNTKKK